MEFSAWIFFCLKSGIKAIQIFSFSSSFCVSLSLLSSLCYCTAQPSHNRKFQSLRNSPQALKSRASHLRFKAGGASGPEQKRVGRHKMTNPKRKKTQEESHNPMTGSASLKCVYSHHFCNMSKGNIWKEDASKFCGYKGRRSKKRSLPVQKNSDLGSPLCPMIRKGQRIAQSSPQKTNFRTSCCNRRRHLQQLASGPI